MSPDAFVLRGFENPQPIAGVSSTSREFAASVSKDELEMSFVSDRTGYLTWTTTRKNKTSAFAAPSVFLAGGAQIDAEVGYARDGLEMVATFGNDGMRRLSRATPTDPWSAPVNTMQFPGYAGFDIGGHDLRLVMHDSATDQLWEATRPDTASLWSAPVKLEELVGYKAHQNYPTMTDDGLEILWQAYDTAVSPGFIYHARRPSLDEPFGPGETAVDIVAVGDPGISADGETLYFSHDDGKNMGDLYTATRIH